MQTPDASLTRHAGWLTVNLVAQLAFGLLAMTICLPSMQDWPREFAATQGQVQLSFSVYVAAFGLFQLGYGAWSDRIGRKPVLLTGMGLAGAASVLGALAPDLWTLTLARLLQGAGAAAGMVVGRAMVQDLFVGRARTRVMAVIGMSMGLCPPLAMLVGGQVHVAWGWEANFWAMACLAAALMVAAAWGLPGGKPVHEDAGGRLRTLFAGYAQLVRAPAFVLYALMLAMTAATFYTFLGGAPLVLAGYGVPPDRIGWYVMSVPIAYVVGNLLTTRLIHRLGDQALILAGYLCSVASVLLLLVLGLAGFHTPLYLALPLLLLGIGHGLLMPAALTGTVGLFPALAGSAAAVAGLMQQMTGSLGGFLVGQVPHQGPVNLALQMLGWAVGGLATVVLLRQVTHARL